VIAPAVIAIQATVEKSPMFYYDLLPESEVHHEHRIAAEFAVEIKALIDRSAEAKVAFFRPAQFRGELSHETPIQGLARPGDDRIFILDGLSLIETINTAVHEQQHFGDFQTRDLVSGLFEPRARLAEHEFWGANVPSRFAHYGAILLDLAEVGARTALRVGKIEQAERYTALLRGRRPSADKFAHDLIRIQRAKNAIAYRRMLGGEIEYSLSSAGIKALHQQQPQK
jgi:hypothetical protein